MGRGERLQNETGVQPTRWAELDERSLALFRMALGLFILGTVASFAGSLTDFFTDVGVLPREALVSSPFARIWPSLHMGTGSLHTQVLLQALLAAFGVGLILGWRTPWMLVGCWVLLNSLQARNPFVFDRGDLELELMLFWAFWLPLGARWSLDSRAGRQPLGRATGIAAAALVAQFGMIYLFTAVLKEGPFWLARGDGLYHSLISPLFGTSRSFALATLNPEILHGLTYGVVAGEYFLGFLLLCPWGVPLVRGTAVALLMVFHFGVAILFQLGMFPWIGMLLPLGLIPKEFWQGGGSKLAVAFDRRLGGLLSVKRQDETRFQETHAQEPKARIRKILTWDNLRSAWIGLCLGLALLSNLVSTSVSLRQSVPQSIAFLAGSLRLSQHWDLFAPIPPYNGQFLLTVTRVGAVKTTVFEGPPNPGRPALQSFPNHRWRMLMIASLYPEFSVIREGTARRLAARLGYPNLGELDAIDYGFVVQLVDASGSTLRPERWSLFQK